MMFDIGWSELLVIGVVALIVIGPKDLPKALKTAGTLLRKARQISGEFRASLDEMVREAELEEVRAQVKKATEIDIEREFEKTVDPTGSLAQALQPPELGLDAPEKPRALEPPPAVEETPAAHAAPAPKDSPEGGAAAPPPKAANL